MGRPRTLVHSQEAMHEVIKGSSQQENQSGNMDGDTKELHGKYRDDPVCFDLAIPGNDRVPSHTPEFEECIVETSPGTLAILKNFNSYHYDDLLSSQFSFLVSNKLLSQHFLVNPHLSILEKFEEEITFYYPSDFPQAICEVVPSIEMMHHELVPHHDDFSDGELLPVNSRELAVGLNRDPLPIAPGTFTGNEECSVWETPDLYPNDWTPYQPNLHLFYKLLAKDHLEILYTSNVEGCEEETTFSSLKNNGEFDYQHSIMETHCMLFGTSPFPHHANNYQSFLTDDHA